MIYREDIKANPEVLYIFGDNLERRGFGGQAKEMRGETNSFGIATKRKASHVYPESYFFDWQEDAEHVVINDFFQLRTHCLAVGYKAIVIPFDGIGTGLSKLPEYAPKLLEYINQKLLELGKL